MINEQELKDRCTPEFIKFMVELAEGFRDNTTGNVVIIDSPFDSWIFFNNENNSKELQNPPKWFPLLIHRTAEGFNKANGETGQFGIYIDREKITFCDFKLNRNEEKEYKFKNYQPQSLTHAECAMLHCLLDIFEEVKQ